jgi:hypothetical protein
LKSSGAGTIFKVQVIGSRLTEILSEEKLMSVLVAKKAPDFTAPAIDL